MDGHQCAYPSVTVSMDVTVVEFYLGTLIVLKSQILQAKFPTTDENGEQSIGGAGHMPLRKFPTTSGCFSDCKSDNKLEKWHEELRMFSNSEDLCSLHFMA